MKKSVILNKTLELKQRKNFKKNVVTETTEEVKKRPKIISRIEKDAWHFKHSNRRERVEIFVFVRKNFIFYYGLHIFSNNHLSNNAKTISSRFLFSDIQPRLGRMIAKLYVIYKNLYRSFRTVARRQIERDAYPTLQYSILRKHEYMSTHLYKLKICSFPR